MAPFEVKYFEPKEILARMRMQRLKVHHIHLSICHLSICPILISLTGVGWLCLHHLISTHLLKTHIYMGGCVQCFCVIVTPFLCLYAATGSPIIGVSSKWNFADTMWMVGYLVQVSFITAPVANYLGITPGWLKWHFQHCQRFVLLPTSACCMPTIIRDREIINQGTVSTSLNLNQILPPWKFSWYKMLPLNFPGNKCSHLSCRWHRWLKICIVGFFSTWILRTYILADFGLYEPLFWLTSRGSL